MRKTFTIKGKAIPASAFVIAAIVILTLVVAGVYFAASGAAEREPAEKDLPVKFTERFLPTTDKGETFQYIVQAENTGDAAFYVRAKLKTGMKEKTEAAWLKENLSDTWELKDGYCYYTKALTAGETSKPIFKEVKTDDSFLLLKKETPIALEEGDCIEASEYDSAVAAFAARDNES